MKVVLIHNQRPGGCHRRIVEQWRHLDVPVTEITFEWASTVTDDPVIVPLTFRDNQPHPLVRPATRYLDLFSRRASYTQMAQVIRDHDPDVIWMNPCHYLQAMWLPADLASRSVFYCDEPRRIDYEENLRQATRLRTRLPYWPLRRLARHLDRSTIVHIPRIATNSHYTVGQIRRAYGCRSEVVRLGVSPQFRPPDTPVERTHLLSVGNLIPTKGHDLVIAAAGRSGLGLPVVVVSHKSNPGEEARLRDIAREAGVELRVVIDVSDDELVALYQSATVTLYVSHAEPFGLVSIEAQACGSPVIVSDEGGLPESIVPGVTGWAVPRTVAGVGDVLAEFADTDLADKFGAAAAEHAATWSWADSARRLETMLAEVAEVAEESGRSRA
jgi:glycosyltransferase involved in cell wall biosynthesis